MKGLDRSTSNAASATGTLSAIRIGDCPVCSEPSNAASYRHSKSSRARRIRSFTAADQGTNYSQARYLCYYLQEQGRLTQFYRDFAANQGTDPTGYNTLVKTLGEDDMAAFQKKWEAFVLGLKF